MGNNNNVTSFLNKSKEFEEAHYTCRELLQDRINNIETFVSRWILIAIATVFLIQILGFIYFHFSYVDLLKKVDHRYFNIKESLEDIHNVKIENGRVIRSY